MSLSQEVDLLCKSKNGIITVMESNRYIKTTIIARALIIMVIGFYVSLFVLRQWFISPLWMAGLFCVLPYAIIYFHRQWKYGIGVLTILNIGLGFYVGWNVYLVLGFASALVALYKTSHTIHEDIHNKIKVSDFDIFTGESVSTFVMYMTLVYVFTFMSFYQTFNLTCQGLYFYTNKIVNTALLRNNPEIVETIKGYMADFFTTNVDTLINTTPIAPVIQTKAATIIDGNKTKTQIPQPKQEDPGAKYRVTSPTQEQESTSSVIDGIQVHNSATTSGVKSAELLRALDEYRKKLLEQTIDNSDSIEQGVCSMIVREIKHKYNNPQFRISVIFMMYLLIRPAMEMALHLISYINRAIFRIMFKIGWFKKYEDWEVAENLE